MHSQLWQGRGAPCGANSSRKCRKNSVRPLFGGSKRISSSCSSAGAASSAPAMAPTGAAHAGKPFCAPAHQFERADGRSNIVSRRAAPLLFCIDGALSEGGEARRGCPRCSVPGRGAAKPRMDRGRARGRCSARAPRTAVATCVLCSACAHGGVSRRMHVPTAEDVLWPQSGTLRVMVPCDGACACAASFAAKCSCGLRRSPAGWR